MEEIFRFANAEYLNFLFLVPILFFIFWLGRFFRKKQLKKFGSIEVIEKLMPDVSNNRPLIKFIFINLALVALIFALAQPQFGSKLEEVKRKGVEIIIALDVSNSMLAEDIKPNRLENAKREIAKLVDKLSDDKLGLIAFAGDAYTQVPITTDFSATKMFLQTINTEIVSKQGTAIGKAIDLAKNSFSIESDKNKVIIIITDGENHEDNAVEKAKDAAAKSIVIHTVGMGETGGSPIPTSQGRDFRKDKNGNVVISKLDEETLKKVAQAGNGVYVRANNSNSALDLVYEEINKMEKKEIESKIFSDYDEQFQYLIALALVFLTFEFFVLERKNRLLKNIKLFRDSF